jgi:hypothetical protein
MLVRFFIITVCLMGLILSSWDFQKCEHIYVAVEQSEIKIEEPEWSSVDNLLPAWIRWPSGIHEGKEIVCVKCFNKRKQVLDYGISKAKTMGSGRVLTWGPTLHLPDTCLLPQGEYFIKVDSVMKTICK